MPWDILLLPLLGGYLFVTQFKLSRYFARRHTRERLIFLAAIAGAVLFGLGRLVALTLVSVLPSLYDMKSSFADVPYLGTAILAFLGGAILWMPANRLVTTEKEIRWIMRYGEDQLQHLLYEAQKSDRMVSVTLESGKVYIGFVTGVPLNMVSADSYIQIGPNMSGYRDQETKKLVITTFYEEVMLQLREENRPPWLEEDDFKKVIPVRCIEVAGFFDPEAYLEFLQPNKQIITNA